MRGTLLTVAMVVAIVLTVQPIALEAQTTYGRFVGNVRDSSDSVMSGVKVTVTSEGTGESFTQSTNELGAYAFQTLIPGDVRDPG